MIGKGINSLVPIQMAIYLYLRGWGSNSKEFTLAMLTILSSFFTEKKPERGGPSHALDKRRMEVVIYDCYACTVAVETHCVRPMYHNYIVLCIYSGRNVF